MYGDWNSRILARNVVHADPHCRSAVSATRVFLSDNAPIVGQWKVVDIGLSRRAIEQTPRNIIFIEKDDVRRVLKRRPDFCSKADFGHALLFTGCYGMMRGCSVAARGSFALGCGQLTVQLPAVVSACFRMRPRSAYLPDRNENVISDMTRASISRLSGRAGHSTNDAIRERLRPYQDHKTADGVRCRCPQHHLPHACAHGPHIAPARFYAPCR